MSTETKAWAKRQKCGNATTKSVLIELANWADPSGFLSFRKIWDIAEVVEVDPRTVQRHIRKLEEPTVDQPDRLGLIRRVAQYREDGSQGANAFQLIGYQQPLTESGDKPQKPRGDNLSPPHDNLPPGDDNLSGDGVTLLSPLKGDKDSYSPPAPLKGGSPPQDDLGDEGDQERQSRRGTRLPEDFDLVPIDELPEAAQAMVRQWPEGAYELLHEKFCLFHRSATGRAARSADWPAKLAAWVLEDHPKMMRADRSNISMSKASSKPAAKSSEPVIPVDAKNREDTRSDAVRQALRRELGSALYLTWFSKSAILLKQDGAAVSVEVVCPNEFTRDWIFDRFRDRLAMAANTDLQLVELTVEQKEEVVG